MLDYAWYVQFSTYLIGISYLNHTFWSGYALGAILDGNYGFQHVVEIHVK